MLQAGYKLVSTKSKFVLIPALAMGFLLMSGTFSVSLHQLFVAVQHLQTPDEWKFWFSLVATLIFGSIWGIVFLVSLIWLILVVLKKWRRNKTT